MCTASPRQGAAEAEHDGPVRARRPDAHARVVADFLLISGAEWRSDVGTGHVGSCIAEAQEHVRWGAPVS